MKREYKIFTLEEAADFIGKSKRQLQRYIKKGDIIPVWGKPRAEFVEEKELETFLNRRKQ